MNRPSSNWLQSTFNAVSGAGLPFLVYFYCVILILAASVHCCCKKEEIIIIWRKSLGKWEVLFCQLYSQGNWGMEWSWRFMGEESWQSGGGVWERAWDSHGTGRRCSWCTGIMVEQPKGSSVDGVCPHTSAALLAQGAKGWKKTVCLMS